VRDLLPPFRDETVGMVQARWDHLNRDETWFTEALALLLFPSAVARRALGFEQYLLIFAAATFPFMVFY
jgi:hypothetical protein